MSRVALDSNILVYAELEPESAKGKRAAQLILRAAHDGVIPAQVLGELLRVVQRRAPGALVEAVRQVALYRALFRVVATTEELVSIAAATALTHRLQFWDALICAAAAQAGACALLSEDMQDGRQLDGLKIVNPFTPANADSVNALLGD